MKSSLPVDSLELSLDLDIIVHFYSLHEHLHQVRR